MSFYDLTKSNVLSANELFKYRLKRDATVPSKGGQKAFEPDGSWMHSKALESLMQERTKFLGEQRVEKLKSLVQGVWEEEKRLVDLSKPGKFWSHMGFTDKRRNWLYPEEALFLMETNTLEVYCNDLPLSIQEAYTMFMGPDLCLEEYQVFAHLRRLGYVVLRQEAELEITPYEKQINLDKYMTKQNRKERKEKLLAKRKKLETDNPSMAPSDGENPSKTDFTDEMELEECDQPQENSLSDCSDKDKDTLRPEMASDTDKGQDNKVDKSSTASTSISNTKSLSPEVSPQKKFKSDTQSDSENSESVKSPSMSESPCLDSKPHMSWYLDDAWSLCFQKSSPSSNSDQAMDEEIMKENKANPSGPTIDFSKNDEKQIFPFPTIAHKSTLSLPQPWAKLLPSNVDVNEDYDDILIFDVDSYRREHPPREESRNSQRDDERETRIRNLKFSFAEWTRRPPIKANSWTEYKKRAVKALANTSARTPVDHLWHGEVAPLVKPGDAWSKQTILDRLSIIKTADNETLLPNQDCMVDLKVSYCVHLPDSRFKKSMPGTPDHRICVVKCSSEPPNLAEVQEVWSRFKDGVPLHCAVVDSGEIAFYMFDNTFQLEDLPQ